MNRTHRLMHLFGVVRGDHRSLIHARSDIARRRIRAHVTETMQQIEFLALVEPELESEPAHHAHRGEVQ
jgi:hypothetical protein